MTEQGEKKLNFECTGARLAPAEKKAGCFFVARMAALLPVQLEPAFSFQRKKSLQGWQWFNWDGCSSLGAANEVPECRRFVCCQSLSAETWTRQGCTGTADCGKGKARRTFLSSLEFSMTFPPSGCVGRRNKEVAHPKEGIYEI